MYKKTIKYVDYDGNERTEDFYFNLSKAEMIEMEFSFKGGFTTELTRAVKAQDTPAIFNMFKNFITKSYGVKSANGKSFVKSQEVLDDFLQSEAYSELLTEMFSDTKKMVEFFNGIFPADVVSAIRKNPNEIKGELDKQGITLPDEYMTLVSEEDGK